MSVAACEMAKSRKTTLAVDKPNRAPRIFLRAHLDIGYADGKRVIFLLYIDDCSRKGYLVLIPTKADARLAFKKIYTHLSNKYWPTKLAYVRHDAERCLDSNEWKDMCDDLGIVNEPAPATAKTPMVQSSGLCR